MTELQEAGVQDDRMLPRTAPSSWRGAVSFVSTLGVAVASGAMLFAPLKPEAIGGVAVIMMLAMMGLRFQLAVTMIIPSLIAMPALCGSRSVVSTLTTVGYDTLASWTLSVIPMFVLVGVLLSSSGLATRTYDAAQRWLAWIPGGLAVGTNIAGAGLSSISGSSMATTYTLTRIGLPEMLGAGYSVRYSLTAVMSAGLPGQLIPPSILVILMTIIIGGMYSGIVTATEAGAVAALASILILLDLKRDVRESAAALVDAGRQAVSTIGTIFMLLIGVEVMSRMMSLTRISSSFSGFIEDADLSRVEFLLLMTLIYLVLGTFMETLPMMLLTVPVLIPTLAALEVSLLWFGAFVVLMGELAMLSPPVGVLAMVVYTIARLPEVNRGRQITLKDVFVATFYVLPTAVPVVLLMIAFPDLVTYLAEQGG